MVEHDDKQEIESRLLNRKSAFFPYMEYLAAKLAVSLCCCFKSTDWFKRRKL